MISSLTFHSFATSFAARLPSSAYGVAALAVTVDWIAQSVIHRFHISRHTVALRIEDSYEQGRRVGTLDTLVKIFCLVSTALTFVAGIKLLSSPSHTLYAMLYGAYKVVDVYSRFTLPTPRGDDPPPLLPAEDLAPLNPYSSNGQ